MQWTIILEATTGWGERTCTPVYTFSRPMLDLKPEQVGLTLAEAKTLLARLQEQLHFHAGTRMATPFKVGLAAPGRRADLPIPFSALQAPGHAVGLKPSGLTMRNNLVFHRVRIGGLDFEAMMSADGPALVVRGHEGQRYEGWAPLGVSPLRWLRREEDPG